MAASVDPDDGNIYSKQLEDAILPEQVPPLAQNLVLGIQHVLAMFGATVLGPLLMGFDPNTAIFFSGIATLIFYVVTDGKVPSYLGSSFSFIAAVTAATGYAGSGPNPNIAVALGGIVVAGAVYTLIGAFIWLRGTKWINIWFPQTVTGSIVAIIGLNLSSTAVKQLGDNPYGVLAGLLTLLFVCLFASYARGFSKRIPVLLGAVCGTIAYYALANVAGLAEPMNFSGIASAAWFGLPAFQTPVFEPRAIGLIAPVAIILVAENLGHIKAIGGMVGRDLDRYMGRAFVGDGIATIVSGAAGGTGVTTYAENMGVMRITRNFSSMTMVLAAIIAIFFGLSPKFGQLIRAIPVPVLGGLSVAMFGIISSTALSMFQQGWKSKSVDFDHTRTLLVFGTAVVLGAGNFTITVGGFSMGGIVTATLAAFFLYHITRFAPGVLDKSDDGDSPYNS